MDHESASPLRRLAAACAVTLTLAASPALAAGGAPEGFPTLSSRPEIAQRQAIGCSVVGLGVTGLALASGTMATAGGGATAAPAVAELLAFFGAGCTMGAFIATAFPPGAPAPEAPAPARESPDSRRLRIQAAEYIP
ncbi:hypothetical protein [Azospirillum thermophilum]|uniref:Uncharacterized protein n=1 Tax=Azospirillum thermophilum TaxID=2202148 RepID=A0A2S2CQY5_9PROT|nr:hypothetical protein [Azospirillum thermophilum]AWK86934.1 hypothetical protein DEW08_12460 [Azospirillum thermophilum]